MCRKKGGKQEKLYVCLYKYRSSLKDIQGMDYMGGREEGAGWQKEGGKEELSL